MQTFKDGLSNNMAEFSSSNMIYEVCSIDTRNTEFKLFRPVAILLCDHNFSVLDTLVHAMLHHLPLKKHTLFFPVFSFKCVLWSGHIGL